MMSNKYSSLFKLGSYAFMQKFFKTVFAVGSFFFLVRMVDKEAFGIWVLFMSTKTLLEMARMGLIKNALIKYFAGNEEEHKKKVLTASFTINILFSIVNIAAILVSQKLILYIWPYPTLVDLFNWYIIIVIITTLYSQFQYLAIAKMDFESFFLTTFIRQGLFFMIVVVLYFTNSNIVLVELVIYHIICIAIATIVAYLMVRKSLAFSKSIDWPIFKQLFVYGQYIIGTSIGGMLYKSMDQLMLGSMISSISVAIYNAAIRVINLVEIPVTSMADVYFSYSTKKMKTHTLIEQKQMYEKSVGAIMGLILPIIIIVLLFAKWIIIIVAGKQYIEAANILRIAILMTLFIPFNRQFGTTMDAIGQPKINFMFTNIGAVFNFILNYLLIKSHGIYGALTATIATHFLLFCIEQYYLWVKVKISFKSIFISSIILYKDLFQEGKKLIYTKVKS